jgi:hypothetical protein
MAAPHIKSAPCTRRERRPTTPNVLVDLSSAVHHAGALKVKQACQYLGGVSPVTLHRLVRRGLIKPCRATRHLLFPVAELSRFLRDT